MTARRSDVVDVVVPEGIDDAARPSGGNRYDRRLCEALSAAGWDVRERPVPGDWPLPDPGALTDLEAALTTTPERVILLDGLLASGAGASVARAARAGPVAILVHMPFAAADRGLAESERLAFASAAGLVATSSWTADLLRGEYGIDGERITVATPGTDPPPLRPMERAGDGSRLLCVAAVTRTKGLDVLAGALERLAGSGQPDWTCTVAGRLDIDAGFAQRLRARLDAAGLSGRVHLTGPLPPWELSAAYREADVLVVASLAETWGLVVTEALAHGLPVVATRVGGLPEALGRAPGGERPGLLVPPGDADPLAAALRTWLGDDRLRSRLRLAARARGQALAGWGPTAGAVAAALEAARDRWAGETT